jgi:hypothetical protein
MANALPKHPPEEFERMFVQLGRVACESHFKASRRQIDAWLRQIGKSHLIEARSGEVTGIRQTHRRRSSTLLRLVIVQDSRPANPQLVRMAADYLRCVRNGGWIVSRSPFGDWRVGMRKLSAHQMIEFAVSKGFDDRAALQAAMASGVETA